MRNAEDMTELLLRAAGEFAKCGRARHARGDTLAIGGAVDANLAGPGGNIGPIRREIIFEPLPETMPVTIPAEPDAVPGPDIPAPSPQEPAPAPG